MLVAVEINEACAGAVVFIDFRPRGDDFVLARFYHFSRCLLFSFLFLSSFFSPSLTAGRAVPEAKAWTHSKRGKWTDRPTHTETNGLINTHLRSYHARARARTHAHTHTHAHARTHTRGHARTHAHAHTHARTHARTHTHTQAYTGTQHTRTHTRTHANTHTHALYARTHARTHAHTHTHTHFLVCLSSFLCPHVCSLCMFSAFACLFYMSMCLLSVSVCLFCVFIQCVGASALRVRMSVLRVCPCVYSPSMSVCLFSEYVRVSVL